MSSTISLASTATLSATASAATTTFPLYNYPPNGMGGPHIGVCILLLALLSITVGLHLIQSFMHRKYYFLYTMFLGGLGEVACWACRLIGSRHPMEQTPYTLQIVFGIFSPTFLSAANFITFGTMITFIDGQRYALLTPRRFTRFFVVFDITCLVIQSAGGVIATSNNVNIQETGANIALGGIGLQTFAIVLYSALALDFIYRLRRDKPVNRHGSDKRALEGGSSAMLVELQGVGAAGRGGVEKRNDGEAMRMFNWMVCALAWSTLFLLIRSIYRLIEFANGWDGPIQSTEAYFTVFDGVMVFLAMFVVNLLHPGRVLQETRRSQI